MAVKKTIKPSQPEQVDTFLRALDHPLLSVVRKAREAVLSASPSIGEEIKWNAPSFYYAGQMKPTDPKLYARYLVSFNLFKKDCLRLIFLRAGGLSDPTGLLEGDYEDGRRIALLSSLADIRAKAPALKAVLRQQLAQIEK